MITYSYFAEKGKWRSLISTKGENQMKAVNLSLPSIKIAESDQKYQKSFWLWYEKLASFCDRHLTADWMDKVRQDPDKWPYY
jgi:hypothetical protein